MPHPANWYFGWAFVLASFLMGAALGLFFAREEFLGGYTSWSRRLLRLGHIALAALGLFNVVYAIAPLPLSASWQSTGASLGLIIGGMAMPLICFLAAWRPHFKAFFFLPVSALIFAIGCILAA